MELWLGPKGAVGVKINSGMGLVGGSWVIILHHPSGKWTQVELYNHNSRESQDGTWKFGTKFKAIKAIRGTDLYTEMESLENTLLNTKYRLEDLKKRLGRTDGESKGRSRRNEVSRKKKQMEARD